MRRGYAITVNHQQAVSIAAGNVVRRWPVGGIAMFERALVVTLMLLAQPARANTVCINYGIHSAAEHGRSPANRAKNVRNRHCWSSCRQCAYRCAV